MSRMHVAGFGALALVLGCSIAAPALALPEDARSVAAPLTVEACVAIALAQNPDSLSGDYEVKGAEAARSAVGGQFGPKLHVDAAVDQWNSAFILGFGGQALRVREPFTWTASVTLSQPLTGLWQIYDQYKVQSFGVDVAAIRRRVARRGVALHAIQAFYALLEASRLSEVADASVKQLEAQEKQATSLHDNGVIGKNDLLRADLALATARQRSIQARGQVILAQARLAQAIGVSPDAPLQVVPFTGQPPSAEAGDIGTAETLALSRRVELRALDRRIQEGEASVGVATAKFAPQISAVANYTHFDGSAFQQADAEYVGLVGSWDVWDWGTTFSGIAQAKAELAEARIALTKLRDEIRVDARHAFVDAQTAHEGLGVAKAAVSQAEENYRIVTKKFDSSAATSFDVVDAEALLTEARAQVETALYDYLIARAALESATGAQLSSQP